MVFTTEYYGCVYIDTCDAHALLADIRRCLAGSILVLNDKAVDFPVVLRVYVNGTHEFVDFSPTLNALFDVLTASNATMRGCIIAIEHNHPPRPTVHKFDVRPMHRVAKPISVIDELEKL